MNNKILIIAVIAIVAIVAVGAAVMMMGGGDNKDPTPQEKDDTPDVKPTTDKTDFDMASGALMIYGNANMDNAIDQNDVAKIQELISSNSYALVADANMDGKIDSNDVTVIKRLMAGQSTVAYYQDMTDGPTAINYPVTSFMGVHQFTLMPMMAIGALQYMDGYTIHAAGQTGATMMEELYDTETNVNTSYNQIDVEKLSSLPKKPKVVLTYSSSLSNENKVEKSGIQMVHLQFGLFKESMSAVLTFGYLLNLYDNAKEYVQFINDVVEDVDAKVLKKLGSDSDRKSVMCGYMTNCIDHANGAYVPMAIAAGAKSAFDGTDMDSRYIEFNRGDEWITAYNEDFFFYFNTWGYTENVDLPEYYKKSADYFTTLQSYKAGNFVAFNSVLPPVLMVAYMAEVLYGDYVGEGYGDAANQAFIQKFFPDFANGYDASDYHYFITYDMVKDKL